VRIFIRSMGLAALVLATACGGGGNGEDDAGTLADGGGTADGGGGANPCGLPNEPEPNDDRDHAAAYELGTSVEGCIATKNELDFYQFTAPSDPAGGYVQVAVTNVGNGYIQTNTYAASDNGEILQAYAANKGQSVNYFFSVAPGQTYRIAFTDWVSVEGAFAYTLQATYTAIADAYEPNDTVDQAKAITVGTPIQAYLFAGFTAGGTFDADSMDDWYQFTAAAGNITVTLSNVPTDTTMEMSVHGPDKSQLGGLAYNTTAGANVTATRTAATAGTYYVRVGRWVGVGKAAGIGSTVPDRFTRPYTLSVTQ
jgi:hypothetical protein